MKTATIIGGGLAGLSLATELAQRGMAVEILEKDAILGGRASNVYDKTMHDPVPIGPHIYLTGYSNFRKFLKKVGAKEAIAWEKKLFLEMVYNGEHKQFRMVDLPTSLRGLARIFNYRWLTTADILSNIRIATHIMLARERTLEKLDEISAYDYLLKFGVTKASINKMWRFFVLSMLNVPLEICSAAEFALLVKFWSTLKGRRIGFAKVGLGDIYTDKSEAFVKKHRGKISMNTTVESIVFGKDKISHLIVSEKNEKRKIVSDYYISTLTPVDLRSILPQKIVFSDFFRGLNAFEPVPYISVNLWFDRKISDKKFWALLNDEETPRYMNTDFYDQSNIYQTRKKHSFITSNVIYSQAYEKMSDKAIVSKTLEELREAFPKMTAKLTHYKIHRIPYAIYAPLPGMRQNKLSHRTPFSNLFLAGDWTVKDKTQCMEAAVRSGYRCAEQMIFDVSGKNEIICIDEH